jgi:predicted DNA-binding transcriptional regulator AlpA
MTRPAHIEHGDVATRVVRAAMGQRRLSAMRPVPRRGLSRIEAAMYLGVGANKFDEMVTDGRMPKPKRIDNRKIWDIIALDQAFDLLPDEDGPPTGGTWDDA